MPFASSQEVLFTLLNRIFCDTFSLQPQRADAGYLFGETVGNETPALDALAELHGDARIKKVAVCGFLGENQGELHVRGYEEWEKILVNSYRVPKEVIVPVPLAPEFPPSTDAEALGLVRLAKTNGWNSIYLVAPMLHQVRCFVSTVSAMFRESLELRFYSVRCEPQLWTETVKFSQSVPRTKRSELPVTEIQKINRYSDKGDLVSAERVLQYLEWRDSQ